ncbi:MAG: AAA family ATPase [Thermodesulfobacteriota bacterium]
MRFFNTAGPVRPEDHYCLPPLGRLDLPWILTLIAQKKYFVLHAPRQTGKTTCLLALMDLLNAGGRYRCLYVNVEPAQAARNDVARGITAIVHQLATAAFLAGDPQLEGIVADVLARKSPDVALEETLTRWCMQQGSKPLVLLVDEIDTLVGDTLISVLRQVRAGYPRRPALFPSTVVLCGVRDVRDYRIHQGDGEVITGGSAFNIKAESLRLGDFSRSEVQMVLAQHREETGQVFLPEAVQVIWDLSQGQPWLVNALAYEACFRMEAGRDRSQPIAAALIDAAREQLILRREPHLDQLADKLQEERVRRVIQPILEGSTALERLAPDDIEYAVDLGLITTQGNLRIANPIYQEIIPRQLTASVQVTITHEAPWYLCPDGRLDMNRLLAAFQDFFREHAESWLERFHYREAGPQLLMQAFLQRIVNGGGRIDREYGLGRMRTDLLLAWPHPVGVQKVVIELKVLHKGLAATVQAGLAQTWEYADRCGAGEAHLVIFDRTPDKPWEEKCFRREEECRGRRITVWGL